MSFWPLILLLCLVLISALAVHRNAQQPPSIARVLPIAASDKMPPLPRQVKFRSRSPELASCNAKVPYYRRVTLPSNAFRRARGEDERYTDVPGKIQPSVGLQKDFMGAEGCVMDDLLS